MRGGRLLPLRRPRYFVVTCDLGDDPVTMIFRAFAILLFLAGAAFAELRLDAQSAHERMKAGELVLVDVRTPQEWKSTGVAAGAVPITMNSRDFDDRMRKLVAANPGKDIAFICAAGGRSASMRNRFARMGLADSYDVEEGMLGRGNAPGWIARGLPMQPYAQ